MGLVTAVLQFIIMRGGPVYIVKPKYIFKHPFNKFDLGNPSNRETQNQELTDYFNYGFNEDTMNIYGKLVKRFIEVLDHHKNLEYFNGPSELMRLNDQIPMDFGGFNKFHDPWIVDNQTPQNFHDGENLMRYFIMMIFANASRKVQYPLIQFITKMYKHSEEDNPDQDTSLFQIIEQIGKNLQARYNQTMEKLIQKANEAKNPSLKKAHHRDNKEPRDKEPPRQSNQPDKNQRSEPAELKKDKSRKSKSQRHRSSDESESDDSDSDSESDYKKKRDRGSDSRERRRKEKTRSKDDKRKKEKKEKHKTKKVKKEKSYKRSKSRDRKKKHH